jgi:SAM-dependent methyltransferase
LAGDGIELGPGHVPYPLPFPGVTVRYVDRWEPQQNADLFPELGDALFPQPDIVCNLDVDRLAAIDTVSVDFVIASHVLEHLAEPLGLIDEIHRVLRPGGVALILLPDRRRTFDVHRPPTELDELVRKHASARTSITDDEIARFLEQVQTEEYDRLQDSTIEERKRILDLHRLRSIHVHCWTAEEFADVLAYCISDLGHGWEYLDGVVAEDEGETGIEFGYAVRKALRPAEGEAASKRFESVWQDWLAEHRALHDRDEVALAKLEATRTELAAAQAEVEAFRNRRVVRATDRVADLVRRTRAPRSPS